MVPILTPPGRVLSWRRWCKVAGLGGHAGGSRAIVGGALEPACARAKKIAPVKLRRYVILQCVPADEHRMFVDALARAPGNISARLVGASPGSGIATYLSASCAPSAGICPAPALGRDGGRLSARIGIRSHRIPLRQQCILHKPQGSRSYATRHACLLCLSGGPVPVIHDLDASIGPRVCAPEVLPIGKASGSASRASSRSSTTCASTSDPAWAVFVVAPLTCSRAAWGEAILPLLGAEVSLVLLGEDVGLPLHYLERVDFTANSTSVSLLGGVVRPW
jgi:hypothetical protein